MRIAFHAGLIVSSLFLPWWVTIALLAIACLVIDRFYEAILYGILLDALYGSPFGFHGFRFVWTSGAFLIFLFSLPIRSRMK